jgi:hypothetical protein
LFSWNRIGHALNCTIGYGKAYSISEVSKPEILDDDDDDDDDYNDNNNNSN